MTALALPRRYAESNSKDAVGGDEASSERRGV